MNEYGDGVSSRWFAVMTLGVRVGGESSWLADRTGIARSTNSAIEMDRIELGAESAKPLALARALEVRPAVRLVRGCGTEDESAA